MRNGGERGEGRVFLCVHTITRLIPLSVFFLISHFLCHVLLSFCLVFVSTLHTPPQPLFPRHENTAHTLLDVRAFCHCVLFASACSFVPTSLIPRTKVFLRLYGNSTGALMRAGFGGWGKGKRLSGL